MFNKSGILSQRQLPLKELTQFTTKKGGLEIYQDTGGTNIENSYLYGTTLYVFVYCLGLILISSLIFERKNLD